MFPKAEPQQNIQAPASLTKVARKCYLKWLEIISIANRNGSRIFVVTSKLGWTTWSGGLCSKFHFCSRFRPIPWNPGMEWSELWDQIRIFGVILVLCYYVIHICSLERMDLSCANLACTQEDIEGNMRIGAVLPGAYFKSVEVRTARSSDQKN